jgi:hypothetical protein
MKKLFLGVSVLLFVACAAKNNETKNTTKTSEVTPEVSKPMPVFSLSKLGGGSLASAELAGKPLMVNFWSPS